MIREGEMDIQDGYVTDLITDDAIRNIQNHTGDENPFYLSIHYTAPHSPWIDQHPEAYTSLYKDCRFESCPQGTPHPEAVYRYDKETARECLIGYFAAVTAMDAAIGRVLDTLEEEGIRENTFIIFLSDNGFNCGHHGIWGKGCGTLNLNMYDTSVKVPCVVSYPGKISGGQVCDSLLSQYDIFPTLMELTGFTYHEESQMPGRSFLPMIDGRGEKEKADIVVFDEYGPVRMIRDHQYKYVHRYPYGPHEFYDLIKDPEESYNYIEDQRYQEIIEEMRKRMIIWFQQYADSRVDGVFEPVGGNGQLCRPGIYSDGKIAFDSNRKATSSHKAGY